MCGEPDLCKLSSQLASVILSSISRTASCEFFDDSSSTFCTNIWHSTPIKKSAYAPKDPVTECTSECSETEIEILDQSTSSGKHCNLNVCQIHFFLLWATHVLTVVLLCQV